MIKEVQGLSQSRRHNIKKLVMKAGSEEFILRNLAYRNNDYLRQIGYQGKVHAPITGKNEVTYDNKTSFVNGKSNAKIITSIYRSQQVAVSHPERIKQFLQDDYNEMMQKGKGAVQVQLKKGIKTLKKVGAITIPGGIISALGYKYIEGEVQKQELIQQAIQSQEKNKVLSDFTETTITALSHQYPKLVIPKDIKWSELVNYLQNSYKNCFTAGSVGAPDTVQPGMESFYLDMKNNEIVPIIQNGLDEIIGISSINQMVNESVDNTAMQLFGAISGGSLLATAVALFITSLPYIKYAKQTKNVQNYQDLQIAISVAEQCIPKSIKDAISREEFEKRVNDKLGLSITNTQNLTR